MGLIPPLNDKRCLKLVIAEARRVAADEAFDQFVRQFRTLDAFIRYVRQLEQRDDLGDPDDGPRIPCEVSQRLRYNPRDPNCVERSAMFLAAAEILDPENARTLASLVLDHGWHTFPVEFVDGRPRVVVLDPISPPYNTMLATAYKASKTSPLAEQHLAPWFNEVARNACADADGGECYDYAIDSLRNALITGEPLEEYDDLDFVLERAAEDAELFGGQGRAAVNEVYRSIRNLSFKLDRGKVSSFVKKIASTAEKVAPDAIKAALIAQYGPAAAVALQGVDLALGDDDDEPEAKKPADPKVGTLGLTLESSDRDPRVGTLGLTLESSDRGANGKPSTKDLLRRMTLGFRSTPRR